VLFRFNERVEQALDIFAKTMKTRTYDWSDSEKIDLFHFGFCGS
jgi:hypothetical protein